MTRETYRLVENIHPSTLLIISSSYNRAYSYLSFPITFFHASAYYSTTLSYISLFLFIFHHFLHDTLLLFHMHQYHPSDILQPLSIFLFLLHIKSIQITHASLFPQVHNHPYNHRTSMLSFHFILQANILPPYHQSYPCTNTSMHLDHHLDLHPISIKHALLISDTILSSNITLNIHFTIACLSCFSSNPFISNISHIPKPSTHSILLYFQIITFILVPC